MLVVSAFFLMKVCSVRFLRLQMFVMSSLFITKSCSVRFFRLQMFVVSAFETTNVCSPLFWHVVGSVLGYVWVHGDIVEGLRWLPLVQNWYLTSCPSSLSPQDGYPVLLYQKLSSYLSPQCPFFKFTSTAIVNIQCCITVTLCWLPSWLLPIFKNKGK